jgi:parallel beta helix pectate lyase-like protein
MLLEINRKLFHLSLRLSRCFPAIRCSKFRHRRLCLTICPLVLVLSVLLAPAHATTVYIDPDNVNDLNENGSISHPFDSWQDVTFAAGNSYLQKCGTVYNDSLWLLNPPSGTADKPIIIGKYGTGAKPVIKGNGLYAVTLRNCSYWTIQDLKIEGGKGGPQVLVYAKKADMHDLKFLRLEIDAAGDNKIGYRCGIRMTRERTVYHIDKVEVSDCLIYNAGGTSNGNDDGINLWAVRSRALIQNNIIINSGGDGVDIAGGAHHIVKNNLIIGTRRYHGIKAHAQQYGLKDVTVCYNRVYDVKDNGLALINADGAKVFNNTFQSKYISWAGGMFLGNIDNRKTYTKNVKIYNNIFIGGENGHGALEVNNIPSFYKVVELGNNCYWQKESDIIKFVNCDGLTDVTSSNFSNWGTAHNSLNENPMIDGNELTPDFSLQSSSPCIDEGTSILYGGLWDIIYNPVIDSSRDIGAYEY